MASESSSRNEMQPSVRDAFNNRRTGVGTWLSSRVLLNNDLQWVHV